MKIFDCCMLFNEIDLLKMRLSFLYEYVDAFVICEANITHSGNPKEYNFIKYKAEFEPWLDKIIFLKYEPDVSHLNFSIKPKSFDPNSAHWQLENGQRNALATFLLSQNDEDYAVVCDVDEIWRPSLTQLLRSGSMRIETAKLGMSFHYYYMNCEGIGACNSTWEHAFYSRVGHLRKNPDLSNIRNNKHMKVIKNSGWHFSYLGGAKIVKSKLESFAHQEINNEAFNTLEHLLECISLGKDYLNRKGHDFAFRPPEYYPAELRDLMISFPQYVRWDFFGDLTAEPTYPEVKSLLAKENLKARFLELKVERLTNELEKILSSISWKMTKPLRELNRVRVNPSERFLEYIKLIKTIIK